MAGPGEHPPPLSGKERPARTVEIALPLLLGFPKPLAQAQGEAIVRALGQDPVEGALDELGGRDARDELHPAQDVGGSCGSDGVAGAQAGRDGLREAREVDDAAPGVERRQTQVRVLGQIPVRVVLHDVEVVLSREREQPMRRRGAERGSGGVVQQGLEEEDPGTLLQAEHRLEGSQVRAFRGAGDGPDVQPRQVKQPEEVVVAGVLHEDGVAGTAQSPQGELEPLGDTGREDDLLAVAKDPAPLEAALHDLSQRGIAERAAISVEVGAGQGRDAAQVAVEVERREPLLGERAAPALLERAWLDEATHEEGGVEEAVEAQGGLFPGNLAHRRHVEAGAVASFEKPLPGELPVGGEHGIGAHPELRGHRAQGAELGPGPQSPALNPLSQDLAEPLPLGGGLGEVKGGPTAHGDLPRRGEAPRPATGRTLPNCSRQMCESVSSRSPAPG